MGHTDGQSSLPFRWWFWEVLYNTNPEGFWRVMWINQSRFKLTERHVLSINRNKSNNTLSGCVWKRKRVKMASRSEPTLIYCETEMTSFPTSTEQPITPSTCHQEYNLCSVSTRDLWKWICHMHLNTNFPYLLISCSICHRQRRTNSVSSHRRPQHQNINLAFCCY